MDPTLHFVWRQYRAWAATARALKRQNTQSSLMVLALTLTGTGIGTLTPVFFPDGSSGKAKAFGVVGAVLLAAATYLAGQLLGDSDRQTWVKARAAAEALKSEACKYAARVKPYDGPDAATLLGKKPKEAEAVVPGVVAETVSDADAAKGLPAGTWSLADYLEQRFEDQRKFYLNGAQKQKGAVGTAKIVSLGLGLIAVVLTAGGSMLGQTLPALLGVFTTAAAAVGAWFQGGHHQQLALMYQGTLVQLGELQAQLQANATTAPQFIIDAETLFQQEHAAWLGEWQKTQQQSESRT